MPSNSFTKKLSTVNILIILFVFTITVSSLGDKCSSDFDCDFGKICCERKYPENQVCRYTCLEESCLFISDCGPSEYCCSNDVCKKSSAECSDGNDHTGIPGWLVAVIVTSVLICIGISLAVFCCLCAASATRNRGQAGVVVAYNSQPNATAFIVPHHVGQPVRPHHVTYNTASTAPTQPYYPPVPKQMGQAWPASGPPPPYSATRLMLPQRNNIMPN